MYAYVKDGNLIATSDSLIKKLQPEVTEIQQEARDVLDENGEVIRTEYVDKVVVVTPFEDGMAYDEVIKTKLEGRICYEEGKIISWENSEEKKFEDAKTAAQIEADNEAKREEFRRRIGELAIQRAAAEELGEDTSKIDATLEQTKAAYQTLNP